MKASSCGRFSLNPREAPFSAHVSMDRQKYQHFVDIQVYIVDMAEGSRYVPEVLPWRGSARRRSAMGMVGNRRQVTRIMPV